MTDKEAMQQALDAFKHICAMRFSPATNAICAGNIERLEAALAQKQTKCPRCGEENPAEIHTCSPQREWVGLKVK